MPIFDNKGKELSPCICSKAKYALRLTKEPRNNKQCTRRYWERVVGRISELNNINEKVLKMAINKYDDIFD
tara:strand:- start:1265 stop:1477 length:213 start_codon:yes stop_codon:yes gene_type:complete